MTTLGVLAAGCGDTGEVAAEISAPPAESGTPATESGGAAAEDGEASAESATAAADDGEPTADSGAPAADSGSAAVQSGGPAATVGGAVYSVDDLHAYLATIEADSEARASRSATAEWLSNWVFFTAVELELAARGVAVTNEHVSSAVAEITQADASFVPGDPGADIAIRQRAAVLAAFDWIEREVPAVTGGEPLRHLCSRHILVPSEAEADSVLDRLGGGESFADLALELSQDPGSGSLGGDLGCVAEGSFVEPFETAAYAVQPGEIVVAESQFGFHVIEVITSGPPTVDNHPQIDEATLADMAADGELAASERAQAAVQTERQALLVELQEAVFEGYASRVSIHERYGRWDPEQFRVVVDSDSE